MKKTYIIAEVGVNHNGSIELAKKHIEVAAESGADAVKFQTFQTEKLASKSVQKADYQKQTTESTESQFDMLKKLELSHEQHVDLINYAESQGIDFLSTPFDQSSADFLANKLNLPRIKLSSGDLTNAPLLLQVARYGKPVLLSTGMATLGEIEEALGILAFGYLNLSQTPNTGSFQQAYFSEAGRRMIQEKVTLLHCTTEYPTPFEQVNLKVIDTLQQAFGVNVGFSDHSPGITVPIAAVARGAKIIEKHFTLDKNLPGPDHKASLNPEELFAMVKAIRETELALGSSYKVPSALELQNKEVARKRIVASRPISKGETFTVDNLTVKRAASGASALYFWDKIGCTSSRDYTMDEGIDQ